MAHGDRTVLSLLNDSRCGYTGVQKRILYPHSEIHAGATFQVSYKSPNAAAIADDGTIEILIRTAATHEPHLTFVLAAGGDAELVLLEDPGVTAAGTGLTEWNMYRPHARTATVTAFHTPTLVGGTVFHNSFLPGGSGGNAPGGVARSGSEWIFAPSQDYAIRGINRAGNAQPMSLVVQW